MMTCDCVRDVLSPYYDGELDPQVAREVAKHLDGCDACQSLLQSYRQLSCATGDLREFEPPARIWASLDESCSPRPTVSPWGRRMAPLSLVALAASLLVAVGILARNDVQRLISRPPAFASHIEQYLAEFSASPADAQRALAQQYRSRAVDLAESVRLIGYSPAIAKGLPPGYELDKMYVWDLPCCRCVQGICKREDGSQIAIFEHGDAMSCCWLNDSQSGQMQCHGKPCQIRSLDRRLAASWKAGSRQLTVIGAKNQDEVNRLVGWFE